MSVKAGELTVLAKDDLSQIDFSKYPNVAYSLDYNFYQAGAGKAITQISIELSDYQRSIRVTGNKTDQVEALFMVLKNELNKHYAFGGGEVRRSMALIFFLLTLPPFYFFGVPSPFYKGKRLADLTRILAVLYACFWISTFFTPYDKLFSGFAVFEGEVSFIKRYSAEMTFFGLAISLLSVAGWVIKACFKKAE